MKYFIPLHLTFFNLDLLLPLLMSHNMIAHVEVLLHDFHCYLTEKTSFLVLYCILETVFCKYIFERPHMSICIIFSVCNIN